MTDIARIYGTMPPLSVEARKMYRETAPNHLRHLVAALARLGATQQEVDALETAVKTVLDREKATRAKHD